eukprot:jgi/Psemu1/22242/gm1.22242_g
MVKKEKKHIPLALESALNVGPRQSRMVLGEQINRLNTTWWGRATELTGATVVRYKQDTHILHPLFTLSVKAEYHANAVTDKATKAASKFSFSAPTIPLWGANRQLALLSGWIQKHICSVKSQGEMPVVPTTTYGILCPSHLCFDG